MAVLFKLELTPVLILYVVMHRNFNKMENKKIASEINYDIETGVYASFDKLKNRLNILHIGLF